MQQRMRVVYGIVVLSVWIGAQCSSDRSEGSGGQLRSGAGTALDALGDVARLLNNPLSGIANLASPRTEPVATTRKTLFGGIRDERASPNVVSGSSAASGLVQPANFLKLMQQGMQHLTSAASALMTPEFVQTLQNTMKQATALMETGVQMVPQRNLQEVGQSVPNLGQTFILVAHPQDAVAELQKPFATVHSTDSPPNTLEASGGDVAAGPLSLHDVVSDVVRASENLQTSYCALSIIQSTMEFPKLILNSTLEGDIETFLGMFSADGLTYPLSLLGREGGAPTPTGVSGVSVFATLRMDADALAGKLQSLSLLLSSGEINPLERHLRSVHGAVERLRREPGSTLTWLGLASSIADAQDTLRRLGQDWDLRRDQTRSNVGVSVSQLQDLLHFIDHTDRSGADELFFREVSEGLNAFAASVRALNATTALPNLRVNGIPIPSTTTSIGTHGDVVSAGIPFYFPPLPFLDTAFGLPADEAIRVAKTFSATKPDVNTSTLPFEVTTVPIEILARRAATIRTILLQLQRSFKTSSELLQDNALSIDETSFALSKSIAIREAVEASSTYAAGFSKVQRLWDVPIDFTVSTESEHAASAGPHQQLAAAHRALEELSTHLMQQRHDIECNPAPQQKETEIIRARALVGSPARMLSDMLHGHGPAVESSDASVPVQNDNEVQLCAIKREAMHTLRALSKKLDEISSIVRELERTSTVPEARDLRGTIDAHLPGLGVPLPPQ